MICSSEMEGKFPGTLARDFATSLGSATMAAIYNQ